MIADKIAEWIHEKGITHAFGIIGGGNVALWDAIARLGKTEIVSVHHEQAAAMASGYFNRIRGGVGSVVLVTTGAGSSNALTGVLAAHMDRVPLLVISGNEPSKYMHAETRVWGVQGYDSCFVAHPIAVWASRMMNSEGMHNLEAALEMANRHPQGPAWVDIPKDVQCAIAAR